MAREDYEHWNEEADLVWWLEEGRHETYEEPYGDRDCDVPENDYDDWDEDGEDNVDDWDQPEDAGYEEALFGDC